MIELKNALIGCYGHFGDIDEAMNVFIKIKDVINVKYHFTMTVLINDAMNEKA